MSRQKRTVSPGILKELRSGKLKFMVNWAKDHSDRLALCFRGNNHCAILYDRTHIFLEGHPTAIKISIDHIKPSNGKNDAIEKKEAFCSQYGFSKTEKSSIASKSIKKENTEEDYVKLYLYLAQMMDYYFECAGLAEKPKQHQIFMEEKNLENGYFIYDMESAKAHTNKTEREKDSNNNRTDMMSLRYNNGMPAALSMIEVKSTSKACKDAATGITEHLRKMSNLAEETSFIRERIQEAYEIIEQYGILGLYGAPEKIESPKVDLPVEIVLYLTDEAVACWKDSRNDFKTPDGWKRTEQEKGDNLIVTYTLV